MGHYTLSFALRAEGECMSKVHQAGVVGIAAVVLMSWSLASAQPDEPFSAWAEPKCSSSPPSWCDINFSPARPDPPVVGGTVQTATDCHDDLCIKVTSEKDGSAFITDIEVWTRVGCKGSDYSGSFKITATHDGQSQIGKASNVVLISGCNQAWVADPDLGIRGAALFFEARGRWPVEFRYPDPTQICVQWVRETGITPGGTPCATAHD